MITDSQIQKALVAAAKMNAPAAIELADDGARGAGRFVLVVRPFFTGDGDARILTRVGAEWYAKFYQNGKRKFAKIGSYPDMKLATARKIFTDDYAPAISQGKEPPPGVRERRALAKAAPTIKDLFDAYVESLRKAGKPSSYNVGNILSHTQCALGEDRPASAITPQDIVRVLSAIYLRGKKVMAHETRVYISAAFNFGLKSAHNYTRAAGGVAWGLTSNPAIAIPRDGDASQPGTRVLSQDQFIAFWRWCEGRDDISNLSSALRLLMVTGQRPVEILNLGKADSACEAKYISDEELIVWEKTKNGMPHAIPLPQIAIDIIGNLIPNRHGRFFERRGRPLAAALVNSLVQTVDRYVELTGAERFTPRDLRRTWKTMTGRAGISKDVRDRLQNHAKQDVSAVHYDRYDYLPEKKAAMATWNAYLEKLLSGAAEDEKKAA